MALLTANGAAVLEAHVYLPRTGGAGYADLRVDGTIAEGAEVTLATTGRTWVGTAKRGDDFLDASWLRVVAGKGGLNTTQPPKFYRGVQARVVLADLLRTAGESLATTATQATLSTFLPFWTLTEAPVSSHLAALASKLGAAWRFLEDGTLWIGVEAWPDSGLDFDEIDRDPRERRITMGVEAPTLLPGTTIGGERVDYVVHHVRSDKVRTVAYLDGAQSPPVRQVDALRVSFGHRVAGPVDMLARYRAKLVSQSSDGKTVDLSPDDARIPGVSGVTLRHGTPGQTALVSQGAYLDVGWSGGDPAQPYAAASWETGASVTKLVLDATTVHLGAESGSQFVALSNKVQDYLTALAAAVNGWTPVPNDGGAALKVALTTANIIGGTWGTDVAASQVKAK